MSSYLEGLPQVKVRKNKNKSVLRILDYWERNVLPQTLAVVERHFAPWEKKMTFEQIRHYLRIGDQDEAYSSCSIVWEGRMPPNVVLPSSNIDWTAKTVDEAIVD